MLSIVKKYYESILNIFELFHINSVWYSYFSLYLWNFKNIHEELGNLMNSNHG